MQFYVISNCQYLMLKDRPWFRVNPQCNSWNSCVLVVAFIYACTHTSYCCLEWFIYININGLLVSLIMNFHFVIFLMQKCFSCYRTILCKLSLFIPTYLSMSEWVIEIWSGAMVKWELVLIELPISTQSCLQSYCIFVQNV